MPLPTLPPSAAGLLPQGRIAFRRFGIYEEDLAIDFAGSDTPALITRLLEQCAQDPEGQLPPGFFRELSAGKRLECLLILAAGPQRPAFSFPFGCAACGEELELELTLEEISSLQQQADQIEAIEVELGGQRVAFRKPKGRDQEDWARTIFQDEGEAARAMLGALAVRGTTAEALDSLAFDRVDKAMDEADPLVNLVCQVSCDACGEQNNLSIDLCETALGMLSRLQKQLILTVHRLASHYHWSEKEIFATPHWRRNEYLELIAAGRHS